MKEKELYVKFNDILSLLGDIERRCISIEQELREFRESKKLTYYVVRNQKMQYYSGKDHTHDWVDHLSSASRYAHKEIAENIRAKLHEDITATWQPYEVVEFTIPTEGDPKESKPSWKWVIMDERARFYGEDEEAFFWTKNSDLAAGFESQDEASAIIDYLMTRKFHQSRKMRVVQVEA